MYTLISFKNRKFIINNINIDLPEDFIIEEELKRERQKREKANQIPLEAPSKEYYQPDSVPESKPKSSIIIIDI
jgi:hypothetical protein